MWNKQANPEDNRFDLQYDERLYCTVYKVGKIISFISEVPDMSTKRILKLFLFRDWNNIIALKKPRSYSSNLNFLLFTA